MLSQGCQSAFDFLANRIFPSRSFLVLPVHQPDRIRFAKDTPVQHIDRTRNAIISIAYK